MSREAHINQRVGREVKPAGRLADWLPLSAWVKKLPHAPYAHLVALLKDGTVQEPEALEADLIAAFLTNEPASEYRPAVEALLLAVLGRDPDATALGFADYLPLSADGNARPPTAGSILDRAVKVGQRTWDEWSERRRRREYLLLEFYDAALTPLDEEGRNERLAVSLRLLAQT
jgi:hypothetical protein